MLNSTEENSSPTIIDRQIDCKCKKKNCQNILQVSKGQKIKNIAGNMENFSHEEKYGNFSKCVSKNNDKLMNDEYLDKLLNSVIEKEKIEL